MHAKISIKNCIIKLNNKIQRNKNAQNLINNIKINQTLNRIEHNFMSKLSFDIEFCNSEILNITFILYMLVTNII